MRVLSWIALILLLIGGLNWGMVGLFDIDVISAIFGYKSAISRIIFILVGLAAIYKIFWGCKKSEACRMKEEMKK